MCYGLSISIDAKQRIYCSGLNSHDQTKRRAGLTPEQQDGTLDYEIHLPDYLTPIWINGDVACRGMWKKAGLLGKNSKPFKRFDKAVEKWVGEHELEILRWFATNGKLHAKAKWKGDLDQGEQSVKGDLYQWEQSVKGNLDQGEQSVKGNLYQRRQSVKGNLYQGEQSVEGNLYQRRQSVKGNLYQRRQSVKGMWFIGGVKNGSVFTQRMLDGFSELHENDSNDTFDEFTKFVFQKGIEEVKLSPSKEQVKP